MNPETVAAAVAELARPLRADGADLVLVRADPGAALVELRLDVTAATCADCVLPPDLLAEVVTAALRRELAEEFELVLHDPRRDRPAP